VLSRYLNVTDRQTDGRTTCCSNRRNRLPAMSPKRGHNIPIRSHPISVLHPPFPFLRLILVPSHFIPFIFVYLLSPSSHALNSTRAIGSGRALSGAEPRPAASNFDIFGVQERYLHGGKDLVFVPLILFKTCFLNSIFTPVKRDARRVRLLMMSTAPHAITCRLRIERQASRLRQC